MDLNSKTQLCRNVLSFPKESLAVFCFVPKAALLAQFSLKLLKVAYGRGRKMADLGAGAGDMCSALVEDMFNIRHNVWGNLQHQKINSP